MPRPQTRSDDDILDATGGTVARLGPERMTLADVGRAVGLSPAALVQRFGSKRRLLLAFAAREAARAGALRERPLPSGSPVAAMWAFLAELSEGLDDPEELVHGLAFLQIDLTDAAFHRHAQTQARAVEDHLTRLIAAGVAAGELLAGTSPRPLARAVHAMWNGAILTWGVQRRGTAWAHVRATVGTLLLPYQALASGSPPTRTPRRQRARQAR